MTANSFITEKEAKEEEEPVHVHEVLQSYEQNLILLVQGTLTTFATELLSAGVLNSDEQQQVTDSNSTCQKAYVNEMMRIVDRQIEEQFSAKAESQALNNMIEILRYIGGPLKTIADRFGKQYHFKFVLNHCIIHEFVFLSFLSQRPSPRSKIEYVNKAAFSPIYGWLILLLNCSKLATFE